jgi:hypothetical protein
MPKRRRRLSDPLAQQPRSQARRPGNFNEQSESRLDPNTEFIATHSSAGGGDPTQILRLARWLRQAVRRR